MKLKNKKALGWFLSFAVALCFVVPGTLAAEADTDVVNNPISIGEVTDQNLNDQETSVGVETPSDADAEKVCTCVTNEDGTLTYNEGCPVHEAPAPDEPEVPKHIEGCSDECTVEDCACACHAEETETPAEPEKPAHIEGCSDECTAEGCACACHAEKTETPTVPKKPAHIEGCSDECTVEGCTCPCHTEKTVHIDGCSDECDGVDCECECHKLSIFERLMACETLDELLYEMSLLTEEELESLAVDQLMEIEYRVVEFVPELLELAPADDQNEMPYDVSIPSEIVHVTKNVTNVAPFSPQTAG